MMYENSGCPPPGTGSSFTVWPFVFSFFFVGLADFVVGGKLRSLLFVASNRDLYKNFDSCNGTLTWRTRHKKVPAEFTTICESAMEVQEFESAGKIKWPKTVYTKTESTA